IVQITVNGPSSMNCHHAFDNVHAYSSNNIGPKGQHFRERLTVGILHDHAHLAEHRFGMFLLLDSEHLDHSRMLYTRETFRMLQCVLFLARFSVLKKLDGNSSAERVRCPLNFVMKPP